MRGKSGAGAGRGTPVRGWGRAGAAAASPWEPGPSGERVESVLFVFSSDKYLSAPPPRAGTCGTDPPPPPRPSVSSELRSSV